MESNYLYNGKELQTDLDLDWYDYGARMYDPMLGKFHSVDPWAEKYYFHSPYLYAYNNPLRFTDYMGMGGEDEVEEKDDSNVIAEALNDFINWLKSSIEVNLFSFRNEIASVYENGTEDEVQETEEKIENAGEVKVVGDIGTNLTEGEIQPYISISSGKQSGTIGGKDPISGFGTITLTPQDISITGGADYSVSAEPSSVSVSFGLQFGSSGNLIDGVFGGSAGINRVGLEVSTTTNLRSQQVGIVFSTSRGWVSFNGGGSTKLVDF